MAKRPKGAAATTDSGATLGFEAQLWAAANALRGSMDAAEYKHVVLGLVFLEYMSGAFEAYHAKLEAERDQGADPEDPDEYWAEHIFWVPAEARWSHLKKNARQPTIGQLVDDAMAAVERDNPSLEGVLPKDYARPALDKQRLGQLIDLVTNIHLGDDNNHARDVLGRVCEYFLGQFATAEGKKGTGEYHDTLGFCKSATLEEIRRHGYVLTPGRYVGAEAVEDCGEPFDEKMRRLVAELRAQQAEARMLDEAVCRNLWELGYDA